MWRRGPAYRQRCGTVARRTVRDGAMAASPARASTLDLDDVAGGSVAMEFHDVTQSGFGRNSPLSDFPDAPITAMGPSEDAFVPELLDMRSGSDTFRANDFDAGSESGDDGDDGAGEWEDEGDTYDRSSQSQRSHADSFVDLAEVELSNSQPSPGAGEMDVDGALLESSSLTSLPDAGILGLPTPVRATCLL